MANDLHDSVTVEDTTIAGFPASVARPVGPAVVNPDAAIDPSAPTATGPTGAATFSKNALPSEFVTDGPVNPTEM